MRLSKRIHAIVDAVSYGETVADIGTDHGYVPMLLTKQGISPYVIMSDISESSLSKAISTFKEVHLETSPDQFRVGNGLDTINTSEVDDVIIGGLGGMTIISILDEDIDKSRSFSKLILQPRKHSGELRYFLYINGWDITEERLAKEGKFICEIITASPLGIKGRDPLYDKGDIRWNYPPAFIDTEPTLLISKLKYKIQSIDEGISNLSKSKDDNKDKIDILISNKRYISELLDKVSK